jgi:hypothetical protein
MLTHEKIFLLPYIKVPHFGNAFAVRCLFLEYTKKWKDFEEEYCVLAFLQSAEAESIKRQLDKLKN